MSVTTDLGKVVGDTGPQGPAGPQGIAGPQGPTGVTNLKVMPLASGNAATDTANLQTALSSGGYILFNNPGTYLWNASSVVKSGTHIIIDAGVTWQQAANNGGVPFLVNQAYSNTVLPVTSMTAVTDVGTIICPNHGRAVGDHIAVLGATAYGYNGVFKITSVTDVNTVVVALPMPPRVATATGTLTLTLADHDIAVTGGGTIDYNFANGNGTASNLNTMCNIFFKVSNLTLDGVAVKGTFKYAWLIACYRNLKAQNLPFNTNSDGLHLQGPGFGTTIGTLSGTTGDDMLAFTIGDYVNYELSRGDFEANTVESLKPQGSLTAFKIAGNPNYKLYDLTIGSISGHVQLQVGSMINDGTNLTYTDIGQVTIGSMDCLSLTKDEFWFNGNNMDKFTVNNVMRRRLPANANGNTFFLHANGTVGEVNITDIYNQFSESFSSTIVSLTGTASMGKLTMGGKMQWSAASTNIVLVASTASLEEANAVNFELDGGTRFLTNNAGTVSRVKLTNSQFKTCVGSIINQGTGTTAACDVYLSNASFDTCQNILNATGPVNVYAGGSVKFINGSGNAIQTAAVAAAVVSVSGAIDTNRVRLCNKGAASTIYCNGMGISNDVINHQTTRTGDVTYNVNVNTGAGTVAPSVHGAGYVRSDGIQWLSIGDTRGYQIYLNGSVSPIAPVWSSGQVLAVTISVNQTINAGTTTGLLNDDRISFVITQNATGGNTVTWAAAFVFPTGVTWTNTGNTASKTSTIDFVYANGSFVAQNSNAWV